MNIFAWPDESFSLRLTVTLLHFLWQGIAIALLVIVAGGALRRASANVRYWFNVSAMIAMVLCLIVTMALVDTPTPAVEMLDEPVALRSSESSVGDLDVAPIHGDFSGIEDTSEHFSTDDINPLATVVRDPDPNETPAERVVSMQPVTKTSASWLQLLAPSLTLAYFAGVLFMFVRLTMALWGGQRLRRVSTPVTNDGLLAMINRQAKQIGLKLAPTVFFCEQISIPVVVGIVQPMILLPATLASGLSPDQLRALVMHELAHIRRFDLLINLLQRIIEAALFFHPAVWYVSRRVSIERENAADDMVLGAGWQPEKYADALVRMAELSSAFRNTDQIAALAASGTNASDFKRRVLRILDNRNTPKLRFTRSSVLVMAIVVVSLLITPAIVQSWAGGDDAPPGNDSRQVKANGDNQEASKRAPVTDGKDERTSHDPFVTHRKEKKDAAKKEEGSSLEVTVLDLYGQPIEHSSVNVFRSLKPDEPSKKGDWQDPATERTWRNLPDKHLSVGRDRSNIGPRRATGQIRGLKAGTYRLVADSGTRTNTPLAFGDVIKLDGKQHRKVTLRLPRGVRVRFEVTGKDGKPLDHSSVWMTQIPKTIPPGMIGIPIGDGAVSTFGHLRPGKYEFTISQDALVPQELEYDKQTQTVEVAKSGTKTIKVALKGRPLTKKEIKTRWPYVVKGVITGSDDQPVANVRVCACDETEHGFPWGPSKLFSYGQTRTDERGRYELRFRGIYSFPVDGRKISFSPEKIMIIASKQGFAERNANRHEQLKCALRLPTANEKTAEFDPEALVLPDKPQTINFVMVPQVELEFQLTNAKGRPDENASLYLHGTATLPLHLLMLQSTNAAGECSYTHLTPDRNLWFSIHKGSGNERTPIMKFPTSGKYTIKLGPRVDQKTGLDRFEIASITAADGTDWKNRVIVRDKFQHDPTEAAVHAKGIKILEKLREANRFWLGLPPDEVRNFTYLFRTTGAGHRFGRVTNPAKSSLIERRGIRYISAIDKIVRNMDNITIQGLTIQDNQVKLDYEVRVRFQVEIGMGSGGSSAQIGVESGTLIVDQRRHTVVESRTKRITEKMSEYIEIRKGYFVPMRVQLSFLDTDLRFRIHGPGLWLFDRAFQRGNETEAAAYIDHIDVNNRLIEDTE